MINISAIRFYPKLLFSPPPGLVKENAPPGLVKKNPAPGLVKKNATPGLVKKNMASRLAKKTNKSLYEDYYEKNSIKILYKTIYYVLENE